MEGEAHPSVGVGEDPLDRAIAKLLLEGATNQRISNDLKLPESTVKWRLHQMYKRVGVASRAQLILELIRRDTGEGT